MSWYHAVWWRISASMIQNRCQANRGTGTRTCFARFVASTVAAGQRRRIEAGTTRLCSSGGAKADPVCKTLLSKPQAMWIASTIEGQREAVLDAGRYARRPPEPVLGVDASVQEKRARIVAARRGIPASYGAGSGAGKIQRTALDSDQCMGPPS